MNKIKTMLLTIVAIFGFTTVSNAASLNGVYLEVGSSAIGADFDGNHNDNDGDVCEEENGGICLDASGGNIDDDDLKVIDALNKIQGYKFKQSQMRMYDVSKLMGKATDIPSFIADADKSDDESDDDSVESQDM